MAANSNLVVKISAVDATSKAIDAVAKKLAGITAPATKVTRSLARLSDASGVTRLAKTIAHLGGTTVRAGRQMVGALGPLGTVTAALSAGGLAKMTSDWAQFSRGLGFDAKRIGANVSDLHALEGSAQLAGTSAESAAAGLRNLQDVMTDAVGGRNNEAAVYFHQIGVAFDDGAGHALQATKVLPKLADAIAGIKNPSLQARLATQFFGGATEAMLPWLRRGSKGMAEYAALAKHFGVETEETTEKADVFARSQGTLALALKGLGNSISFQVSPPLIDLMNYLSELVAANRPFISEKFGSWAKQFGDWVKAIDWKKTGQYFSDLFDRFERWTDAMSKFTVPDWMKRMFGLGDTSPSGPSSSNGGGVNGPLSDDNENAPGSPAFRRKRAAEKGEPDPTAPREPWHLSDMIPHLEPVPVQPSWIGNLEEGPFKRLLQGRSGPNGSDDMMGYFESQGWSHTQAAGIVSNLVRESGLSPDKTGDNGQAYGLAQWHPDRQKDFADWAGHDIRGSSLDEQMRFVQHELTHKERKAADLLRATSDPGPAARVVNSQYERPGDVAGENIIRGSNAEKIAAGTVKVDVQIRGLPPGASATATSSGDTQGGVKIARSMP